MSTVNAPRPARASTTAQPASQTTLDDVRQGRALLRKGTKGPAVTNLQERLNAAGADPKLDADGAFGPKTQAALLAFQQKNGLKADGLVGPHTMGALDGGAPVSSTTGGPADVLESSRSTGLKAPTAAELQGQPGGLRAGNLAQQNPHVREAGHVRNNAPAGSVASKIVDNALADEGKVQPGGKDYKGWQYLQETFEKTTGWTPPTEEIRRDSTPQGKNWCGIWATRMLQKSGVDAKWNLNNGRMEGNVDLVTSYGKTYSGNRKAFAQSIQPGDVILLKGNLNHHAVVTNVNKDGTVTTMDGNHPGIGKGNHKLSDVYAYYRAQPDAGAPPSTTSPAADSTSTTSPVSPAKPTVSRGIQREGGSGTAGADPQMNIDDRFYRPGVTGSSLSSSKAVMAEKVNLNGSKSDRMRALSNFTQFDTDYQSTSDNNGCGATSIVAGAVLQGGQKGVEGLIDVIRDRGKTTMVKGARKNHFKPGVIPEWGQLDDIEARVKAGTVRKQDLSTLKTIVYKQLRKVEHDSGHNFKNETINIDAMRDYIHTDTSYIGTSRPLLDGMKGSNIKLVKPSGEDGPGHFVLMFNNGAGSGENALYDPWPMKEGRSQITHRADEMLPYHHTVKNALW